MLKSNAVFAGLGAAVLASTFSFNAAAGTTEALAACKSGIAEDARLAQYSSVSQNTDEIKPRGRFTNFEIKVNAETADGESARWVAKCKARNSGKLESLELVQISGSGANQVAKTDS